MMGAVMGQVAALAEASQVTEPVMGGVMVEVGGREAHARCADLSGLEQVGPGGGASAAVAPSILLRIEPAAIGEAAEVRGMGAGASLAASGGADEADMAAEGRPVGGVKRAEVGADGHSRF